MTERIVIDEKYTYEFSEGQVSILRHGSPWVVDPTAPKAWIAAANEIAELRAKVGRTLPDPKGGCVCSFESDDRGGGYSELVPEYEPACPEHSTHVYDPRSGVWVEPPAVPTTEQAVAAIQKRLSWPSLHWGAEGLHADALPHIANAVLALLRGDDGDIHDARKIRPEQFTVCFCTNNRHSDAQADAWGTHANEANAERVAHISGGHVLGRELYAVVRVVKTR